MIGQVEANQAFSTVHRGAIYLHLGRAYEVAELDVDSQRAIVDAFDGDWYTQPKKETEVFVEAAESRRAIGPAGSSQVELHFGDVSVTEQVIAYQRKSLADHSVLDLVALDLPRAELPHPSALVRAARRARQARPCRPTCSSVRCTRPSTVRSRSCRCWPCAVAGTSASRRTSISRRGLPTIFIDGHPGGVEDRPAPGRLEFERLVADAARLVGECPCADGCPSCIQSPKCASASRSTGPARSS